MKFAVGTAILPRPGEEPPMPALARRAVNLGRTVAATGQRLLTGQAIVVDASARQSFQRICASCPGGWLVGEICRHPHCGCFTKAKTWLAASQCPAGYWPMGRRQG